MKIEYPENKNPGLYMIIGSGGTGNNVHNGISLYLTDCPFDHHAMGECIAIAEKGIPVLLTAVMVARISDQAITAAYNLIPKQAE